VAAIKEIQAEASLREFAEYYTIEGVHRQHTMPYNPQQNVIIEHRNGTMMTTATSMLKANSLLRWF
jgi:hypothetical protein